MSCTIGLDSWANPIQDLGDYDGPEINSFGTSIHHNEQHGTRSQSFGRPPIGQASNVRSELFDTIRLKNRTIKFGPR